MYVYVCVCMYVYTNEWNNHEKNRTVFTVLQVVGTFY